MNRNLSLFFILPLICLFVSACQRSNTTISENDQASRNTNQIPLKFYKKGHGVNLSFMLTLNDDSTFSETARDISDVDLRTASSTISGTYLLTNDKLQLIPEEMISWSYEGKYQKIKGCDNIKKTAYHYTSDYNLIKYGDLIMLLDDSIYENEFYSNDFIDIANSINEKDGKAGIEYVYVNSDKNSKSVGKDLASFFPDPWKGYILLKPVTGNVTENKVLSKDEKLLSPFMYPEQKNVLIMDIGSKDGIKKGMILYPIDKDSPGCKLIILSTDEKQCCAYLNEALPESCTQTLSFSTKRN